MGKTLGKCDALEVEVAHAIVRRNRFPVSTSLSYIHVLVTASGRVVTSKKKVILVDYDH